MVDIVHELQDYGVEVQVHDPIADPGEAAQYYGIELQTLETLKGADAAVLAVMHKTYREMGVQGIAALCTNGKPIVVDVKSTLDPEQTEALGIIYWRL